MSLSSKRRAELTSGPYTRLLAEHEDVLAELYKCFSVAIPEAARFWEGMADEEKAHRKLLEGIAEKFEKDVWSFARPKFATKTIVDSCENVTKMCEYVANNGISMSEAMKYALQVERKQIEKGFFQVIQCDNPKMINVLQSLNSYSYSHVHSLEREAKRMKWKFCGGKRAQTFRKIVLERTSVKDNIKAVQSSLIGNLVALEEAVANLYRTYSLRLDEDSNFWGKLAAEERQHAAMLKKLYDLLEKGKVFYNVSRFNNDAMLKDIDMVLNAEFEARKGDLSMYSAVNKALEVEHLIAECQFYSTVQSDAPEFKYIAERMVIESKAHLKRLENEVGRAIDMGVMAARPAKALGEKY